MAAAGMAPAAARRRRRGGRDVERADRGRRRLWRTTRPPPAAARPGPRTAGRERRRRTQVARGGAESAPKQRKQRKASGKATNVPVATLPGLGGGARLACDSVVPVAPGPPPAMVQYEAGSGERRGRRRGRCGGDAGDGGRYRNDATSPHSSLQPPLVLSTSTPPSHRHHLRATRRRWGPHRLRFGYVHGRVVRPRPLAHMTLGLTSGAGVCVRACVYGVGR